MADKKNETAEPKVRLSKIERLQQELRAAEAKVAEKRAANASKLEDERVKKLNRINDLVSKFNEFARANGFTSIRTIGFEPTEDEA